MSMVVRYADPVVPSKNNLEKGKIDKDSFPGLLFINYQLLELVLLTIRLDNNGTKSDNIIVSVVE